jgi:CelD/BcsL family acetyltransferase involved in cellulose biosynthesis
VVTRAEELAALRGEWLALLGRSAHDEPTRSPLWIEPWWEVFGPEEGRVLRVGAWYEGDRLIGLAPLVRRVETWRKLLPFSRLEALASGERHEDETCSDYLGLIAERGREAALADDLAGALVAGAFGPVDELVIPSMIADDAVPVGDALGRQGWLVDLDAKEPAPYIPLPATWDEYLQALGQDRRYKVRRALRDFEKWSDKRHRIHVATTPAELDAGFRVLCGLHGERWSERGGGAFGSPRFTAFHREVMRRLLAAGALELSWITVDDAPLCALYNVLWNGKVHFYQSGRKPDLPKGVKPGIVAHAFAIQRAIAAGRREYDFLAGTSRYKADLALAERPLVTLRALRPSPRLRARHLAEKAIDIARRWRHPSV